MLEKRVSRELQKTRLFSRRRKVPTYVDVRKRNSVLLDLEGWYETEESFPPKFLDFYEEYKQSGSRVKSTRWLLRKGLINESEASLIGNSLKSVSFKISCRHNDLLRLAETNHYASCFGNWRGLQQVRLLADPDLAIVYVPDKSGKYLWRALLRLVFDPTLPNVSGHYAFRIYRNYGNTDKIGIFAKLDSILPLYVPDIKWLSKDVHVLTSPTIHNNAIVSQHIWSDHWCAFDNHNRLRMRGVRFLNTKDQIELL